ncbi:DUF2207 domain-containing protein [Streptomyces dysideae]|uniref:TIGR04222 domain-containing membrane protein n=1 Tax=Streptomyces dysideae TaxID=909626 RepID=A0A117RY35_9ACTN|nr:hypothetical protein [Streptomyces dysideae]KUO15770.1 hypothetical protein AQJ91_39800 [Streptomyces dysideae]
MSGGTTVRLAPHEIALLRGGSRAALTVTALALHLRGAVDAGRPGTMRTTGVSADDAGPALPPLMTAVHGTLHQPAGLAELLKRPGVRQALAELRSELRDAGFLRALPPGRTRAARSALQALRAAHPLPTRRKGVPQDDMLLAVALHGDPALRLLAARFAMRAGLTGRAKVADDGLFPHSWGGGGGGAYACSGGGPAD